MSTRNDWDKVLNYRENKSELVKVITNYCKSKSIREKLKYPLVVTHRGKTWKITNSQVNEDLTCNHIEADTRLILEASKSKHPIVLRASDTDVLVLMCYAHQQLYLENYWLKKIDSERYVSVTSVKLYFGEIMCSVLLAYHCITGCDTTLYPASIGKVIPFQRLIERQVFYLLKSLGNHINFYKDVEHSKKFSHTTMYSDVPGESITETRVCMYQKQNIKTSSTLISEEESIVQRLKSSDLQCPIWNQCMKQNMIIPELERCGWCMKDVKVLQVWYVGGQLPPSFTKRKTKKLVNSSKYANKSGDTDDDDDDYIPRKKRSKVCFIS